MEAGLNEIAALARVDGSFVCDNAANLIATSAPAVLTTASMADVGKEMMRLFTALHACGRPSKTLHLLFDSWELFAQDLENAVLCVVCRPGVDRPSLRMTVDMVGNDWRRDTDLQRRLQSARDQRSRIANAALDEDLAGRIARLRTSPA